MASRDKVDVDMFHKSIQYALEKLGKSKSGFETTVGSKFKRKRRVGSGNELVDYSRAPCLGADQKARGLWERDWPPCCATSSSSSLGACAVILVASHIHHKKRVAWVSISMHACGSVSIIVREFSLTTA